jgi:putative ABC transport system substrate-binding protein
VTSSEFARSGGLIGYGVNRDALFYRAASYVDKILKGTPPGDLPIEGATQFELIVNLKTAHALGVNLPKGLVLRADEAIE